MRYPEYHKHKAHTQLSVHRNNAEYDAVFVILVIGVIIFLILPIIIIVGSNIVILLVASRYSAVHRGRGVPHRNALITVTLVSTVFVATVLPATIRISLQAFQLYIPSWCYMTQIQIYYINTACNPIIYTLTNARFRIFIKRLIHGRIERVRRTSQITMIETMHTSVHRNNSVEPTDIERARRPSQFIVKQTIPTNIHSNYNIAMETTRHVTRL